MFCLYMCLCTVYAWFPRSPEEGVKFPRPVVIDRCETPCGCFQDNDSVKLSRYVKTQI